jgi:hypothetical protein
MPIRASSMATQKLYTGRPLLQVMHSRQNNHRHLQHTLRGQQMHTAAKYACDDGVQCLTAAGHLWPYLPGPISKCVHRRLSLPQAPTEGAMVCLTGTPPLSHTQTHTHAHLPASPAQDHKVSQAVCVPGDLATHNVIDGQLHTPRSHHKSAAQLQLMQNQGVHVFMRSCWMLTSAQLYHPTLSAISCATRCSTVGVTA